MAVAFASAAACHYCTLPINRRPVQRGGAGEAASTVRLFCCQGCAWAFEILGGSGEGGETTLAAARLLAAFAAGMVVMVAGWSRYLDAWLSQSRPESLSALVQPSQLETLFARVYEPLAAGAVFALLGWPILRSLPRGLRGGAFGLNTLVTLGVLAAYVGSLVSTVRGWGHTYYDTATMILLLVTAGRYLESSARARAAKSLRRLLSAPADAEVERDGVVMIVPAASVALTDVAIVRPGAAFPVDGDVLEGIGSVNEAALTGESKPVLKEPGDSVIAGAISYDGAFRVRPTRVGDETFLRRLDALVEQARQTRAPIERQADRLASLLTVVAVVAGLGTLTYWGAVRGDPSAGLLHALAVLLIACPCALGVATPLALWAGLGEAARRGILVREAAAMEALGHARHLFSDKTGTLTTGRPRLAGVELAPAAGLNGERALELAAALARHSEHPASRALVLAAGGSPSLETVEIRVWPGRGVSGLLQPTGEPLALGSARLMGQLGLAMPETLVRAGRPGETSVYLARRDRVVALFRLAESVRASAAALRALERQRVQVTVLTGDSAESARVLASELALGDVRAGLLPEDKAHIVAAASRQNGTVVVLGDGINDAPALAAADVGVAMGGGTDLARTSAPVVLAGDDLGQVAWLVALARRVRITIRENLFWAALYNVLGIGLAAAGLLQPVLAAAAMVLSSLLVLGNSLRLQRRAARLR